MPAGISGAALAIGGSVAAAGAGALVSSALAPNPNIPGSQATRGLQNLNFSSPSVKAQELPSQAQFAINGQPGPQNILDQLTGATSDTNSQLDALKAQLVPGFGALTQQQVLAIQNAARKATGDLQSNLASRRILGSSFGQNAVAQVTQQAGIDEANARATSYLQELGATQQIINQQFNNASALAQSELSQANFETTTGVNILNGTQQVFADNSQVIGQLAAANAAGTGAFVNNALNGTNGQPGVVQTVQKALSGTPTTTTPTANAADAGTAIASVAPGETFGSPAGGFT